MVSMKRLASILFFAVACVAQTPTYTTVTITTNTGQLPAGWTGSLQISSPVAIGTPAAAIGQWTQTYPINNSGALSIGLAPNDTMSPANLQYIFQFVPSASHGNKWTQYCTVPTSGSPIAYQTICTVPGVNPSVPPAFNAVLPLVWNVAQARISCPTCQTATGTVSSVFTRTGAVVAVAGDYTAAQVTNAVSVLGSYADPSWITSLNANKLTGTPAATRFWYSDGSGHPIGSASFTTDGTRVIFSNAVSGVQHVTGAEVSATAGSTRFLFTPLLTSTPSNMRVFIAPNNTAGTSGATSNYHNSSDYVANSGNIVIGLVGPQATIVTGLTGTGNPVTSMLFGEPSGIGSHLLTICHEFNGVNVGCLSPNGFYVGVAPDTDTMHIKSPVATTGNTLVEIEQGAADTSTSTLFTVKAWANAVSGYKVNGSAFAVGNLAPIAADTVVMNASGGSAAPGAVAMPSSGTNGCAGASDALTYNTSTHNIGCNTISGGSFWGIFTQSFYNDAATTIPHGGTRYVFMGSGPFDAFNGAGTQLMYFKENRTVKLLCVTSFLTQSTNGTLVGTLLKNGSATALVLTVAAGAVAGNYCDTTHTATFTSGDTGQVQWVNNANTGAGDDALLLQQTLQYQE